MRRRRRVRPSEDAIAGKDEFHCEQINQSEDEPKESVFSLVPSRRPLNSEKTYFIKDVFRFLFENEKTYFLDIGAVSESEVQVDAVSIEKISVRL